MTKKNTTMTPLDIALSFVISYVVNIVPNDWFKNHKSIEEKLEFCFKRAVDRWTNHPETRKAVGEQMTKYLLQLKDFIAHKPVGRHPKENELLRLWSEEILNDEECHQFILNYEHQIMALKLEEGCITAKEILEEANNIKAQIEQLKDRGTTNCHIYWERWAIGPNIKLNTNILLTGREDERQKVIECCYTPSVLYVEAISVKEAIAFSVASVISESNLLAERSIVVTNADAYKEMTENSNGMVFITDIQENAHYVVSHGHSVILCISPSDRRNDNYTISLPIVSREGFIKALTKSGIDNAKAQSYAVDSARDINVLRHLLGFADNPPVWQTPENIRLIIPALLLGEWNEGWSDDKEMIKLMSGKEYADYIEFITPLLFVDEAPLIRIGKIWKVKSPFELMSQLINYITQPQLDKLGEVVEWVLQDDDPDAEEKMNADGLFWWQNKQTFSGNIKEGVFQGLTLLAIVQGRILKNTEWVDNLIENKFKEFDLKRYLTHRHNLRWLAEASPLSFVKFIQNDIKHGSILLRQLMEIKHKELSIIGSEIYYAELLFALEAISWDEQYLYNTTEILIHLCSYPNDSNYSNKPINTLSHIYRFILPQTYAPFEYRLDVLKSLSVKHRKIVANLCVLLLKGLEERVFQPNSHFRWRMREKKESPRHAPLVPQANVIAIAKLLIEISDFSIDEIKNILDLSFNKNMRCCRSMLLDAINEHKDKIKGNEIITENLRKNINHHLQYKRTAWALAEQELLPYQKLLTDIESDDIIIKNKHLFSDLFIKEPVFLNHDKEYVEKTEESRNVRAEVINNIILQKGFDAVWEFEKTVNYKEGIANALFDLYGTDIRKEIYRKYCNGDLDEVFVKQYFCTIFYEKGESAYIPMIEELKAVSEKHISILLYAPGYQKNLSEIANASPSDIDKDYWSKVTVSLFPETEIENIIRKLCYVGRYGDTLRVITFNRNSNIISDDIKIGLLCEMQYKGKWDILRNESYLVAEILKTISLPKDIKQRNLLLQMELFIFDHLRHNMNTHDIHLVQEVNQNPSLLMELFSLAYPADEGHEEEGPKDNAEKDFRAGIAQLAFNFIFHYHEVPCSDLSGKVDEETLSNYFKELKQQAEQCHRTHILSMIIGRILGNFRETEDYPSDILCRFVEYFNDDNVDTEISCAISNRRGMSSRAYFEGGSIERNHVETFTKYRDKARLRSPRLTRIFDNLIKEYQQMAEKEDNRAIFLDLTN